jgi:cytoskeletal protein RodZ
METCRNVGVELWQARKAKGWTRAHASQVTKLRISQLEALESNDITALPPVAYLTKHLRDYARELSLDPADVVTRYLEQFQIAVQRVAPVESVNPAARGREWLARRILVAPVRRIAFAAVMLLVAMLCLTPAARLFDDVSVDLTSGEPKASFGAVRETGNNIAIASRLGG